MIGTNERPTLFELVYDLHKLPTRNPVKRIENSQKIRVWGARFAYNGVPAGVTLQNGVYFDTISEMEEHFEVQGDYEIIWADQEQAVAS